MKTLLVIVGPCSIHDPDAGIEYARMLADAAQMHREDLLVVMRAYFEKPRTTVGWKGLINDPHLDGSHDIAAGLRTARRFLQEVAALGLPLGTEFLEPISPQYIARGVQERNRRWRQGGTRRLRCRRCTADLPGGR